MDLYATLLSCVALFALLVLNINADDSPSNDFNFDVVPGGQKRNEEFKWEGVVCQFTYVCQGGTKEQWSVSFEKAGKKGKKLKFVMKRPGVSYLFFQEFLLEVKGAKIKKANLMGPNNQEIKQEEFVMEEKKVYNAANFKNALNELELTLSTGKTKDEF